LLGFVIPTCYTLFELRETVFVGIPDMRLAGEKWEVDFLPTIQASFPDMLPTTGAGSKGGAIKDAVTFKNGCRLKFMSAGQGDAGLAGPTTRNLVMTEVDKYDTASEISREADPIRQMEARTNAFRDFGRRILMECTVSIPTGRIWQEITQGTDSRLYHPCPLCGVWSAWEREHLSGWRDCPDEFAARDAAGWTCPACSGVFGEPERRSMLGRTVLVHRGQEVTADGAAVGPEPRTETFGLRWSAFDNPFVSTGRLGQDEWNAAKAVNRDSAERAARQFVWAIPYEPPDLDLTHLEAGTVAQRQHATKHGIVPADCLGVAVGVDTGKAELHWSAHAILTDGSDVVIDYGKQTVDHKLYGVTNALIRSLGELAKFWQNGWHGESGQAWVPLQVWVDSGWAAHQMGVYAFCKSINQGTTRKQVIWRPTKGYGGSLKYGDGAGMVYTPPRLITQTVTYIGKGMHTNYMAKQDVTLMHVSADLWKAEFQARLQMPVTEPGSIRIYSTPQPDIDHADWASHVTAERQVQAMRNGVPVGIKWEKMRENHWLDAGYLATAAGEFIRATITTAAQAKPRRTLAQMAGKA